MLTNQSLRSVLKGVPKISAAQSISTTTSFAARPRPRPRPVSVPLPSETSVDEALPPISLLKSAKKSGLLDIEPDAAVSLLRKYMKLDAQGPKRGWVREFCTKQNITATTLTLLFLTLSKCQEDSRRQLGLDLLFSASSIGEPSATLYILDLALRKGTVDLPLYHAQHEHLRELAAPPSSHIKSMVLLGRIFEYQKMEDKALQLYQQAASMSLSSDGKISPPLEIALKGVGYALVRAGQILLNRSDRSGAETAFRKAALVHDDPSGYYNLAKLQESGSERQRTYLLKAATSGFMEAATDLGLLHLARAKSESAENKAKTTHVKLAKEWLHLAATGNAGKGMLGLARVFEFEGDLQSGLKWLESAEKSKDLVVARESANLKMSFEKALVGLKLENPKPP